MGRLASGDRRARATLRILDSRDALAGGAVADLAGRAGGELWSACDVCIRKDSIGSCQGC